MKAASSLLIPMNNECFDDDIGEYGVIGAEEFPDESMLMLTDEYVVQAQALRYLA